MLWVYGESFTMSKSEQWGAFSSEQIQGSNDILSFYNSYVCNVVVDSYEEYVRAGVVCEWLGEQIEDNVVQITELQVDRDLLKSLLKVLIAKMEEFEHHAGIEDKPKNS